MLSHLIDDDNDEDDEYGEDVWGILIICKLQESTIIVKDPVYGPNHMVQVVLIRYANMVPLDSVENDTVFPIFLRKIKVW